MSVLKVELIATRQLGVLTPRVVTTVSAWARTIMEMGKLAQVSLAIPLNVVYCAYVHTCVQVVSV